MPALHMLGAVSGMGTRINGPANVLGGTVAGVRGRVGGGRRKPEPTISCFVKNFI